MDSHAIQSEFGYSLFSKIKGRERERERERKEKRRRGLRYLFQEEWGREREKG